MTGMLRLTIRLEPKGPAGAFVLTDEQADALGDRKKTFPVRLSVNDGTFRLRLARMGGENLVGLRREVRDAAGLTIGELAEIEIELDTEERTVDVPPDLAEALAADPVAGTAFATLAYSHRKEYVRWVTEAKREQTRRDRIVKTVSMVRAGETR